MLIHRRRVLLTGAGALAGLSLTACTGEDPPPVLSVSAQARSGMNPGPDGSDRPVTLSILQMSGSGNFDSADIFSLSDPQAAVGGELIKADNIVLAPGGSAGKLITVQPGTSVIGVTGGFRSPAGKTVRSKIAVPAADQGLIILVGPNGISLSTA